MKIGQLAKAGGVILPLQVMKSAAGYYLGTAEDGFPYSRESAEYWRTAEEAGEALASGKWHQRQMP